MQEIRGIAENYLKIHPAYEQADESQLAKALDGVRGTLILARAPKTARRICRMYGERLLLADRITDRRGFHTLLYPARLSELTDMWRTIVLADGELVPGEAALISERCPRARVLVFPRSRELVEFLKPLALCDDSLRKLYKVAKTLPGAPLKRLAEASGLQPAQAVAGFHILKEMELLDFQAEPFSLTMLPAVKCSTDDSNLLRVLKTISI